MDTQPLYLRQDVQVEPLVDQWYAWSHLLSPATAARNVTERHLKIMDSYVAAPAVHAAAARNRRMLGGPFIDYGGRRVDEIAALRDRTRRERPHIMALSKALADLDQTLLANATGHSLESLYPNVPEPLRGCVELVYDLNNHPSFRLIEPLLYASAGHDESLQSLRLSRMSGDDRPFALSTPRLASPEAIDWRTPFRREAVDALFRLKSCARPLAAILDTVGADGSSADGYRALFTPDPPRQYERYTGTGARWRYFGHACVLVETAGESVLFDPVLSYTYESEVSRYTYLDLPDRIDYVLITHNHQDHILIETLLQIRHKVNCVIIPSGGGTLQDPSLRLLLRHAGFKHVIELDALEEIDCGRIRITAVPFLGEHSDLDIRSKSAYHLRIGRHSLLFAADSRNIEPKLYERVFAHTGPVEVLFLGMECVGAPLSWLYGPLLTRRLEHGMDESRRLAGSDCAQGLQLVEQFGCREVYVYAMGQEPWLNYVMSLKYTERSKPIVESDRLVAACRSRGMHAERLFGEREIFLDG